MTNQADRNLRGFIPISMRVAAVLLFLFHLSIYPAPSVDGNQDEDTKSKLNKLFEMSVEDLLKVEITTAGKTEEKVGDIPASVVVISREEIERYGYSSVAEILENVPGLYNIDSRAANGAVFGVRGYWTGVPRNFIVLVNGVEQADSHGTYHLQNFNLPVEAIDRNEVVRGPMSVMYGSDAFFGAINIITNMPAEEDAATLASVSFGSEKSKRGALRYAFTGDDLTVVFNAGYYDTYGPNEPLGTMVSDLSNLSFFNISEANNNTTTGGRLENSNVYFSLSAKYKEFFADVSLNRSAREEYHFWPSFSDGLLHKKKFTTAAFGYKKEFSDSFSIKGSFKYYLSSYWREFDYFIEDFFGQEIAHSEKYEFELSTEYSPTENLKILTGLTYKVMDSNFKLDLRSIFLLSVGE
ncbi:MAG: TonB-dependent receptor plug domain-containing protein, partial [bacterium]|nr:TonB-dependent receptor plug domain-containing protein [bacterium]